MVDIRRLNKIIEEEGNRPGRTIHDLVREQLQQEDNFQEYHLDNISAPSEPETESETRSEKSPIQETFDFAEAQLADLLHKNSQKLDARDYDKESALFKKIEQLKCKAVTSWTKIIEFTKPDDNS